MLVRERRVYPVLGFASIVALIYVNFGDRIWFPTLWQPHLTFVQRSSNSSHFLLDDRPFYVNGWNSYWLMEQSIWPSSRTRVTRMLRRGAKMGMTVCRTWAFSDGGPNALQISPGNFDERVFQALDFVIVEARRHQIRLILSLVNNLDAFGGKSQYLKWAQAAGVNVTSSADSFFLHPIIKSYYKSYIKSILTRKNTFSGVKYSEEPAIFAWELMNEPRCASNSSSSVLQEWITEMATYIKSLDKKHLVTVGLEGFYGPKRPEHLGVNPGDWAALLGSDFIQNSEIEHIDFASVHAYPDSWIPNAKLEEKVKYLSRWVDSHTSDGDLILKKPVLFTEIGSSLHEKNQGVYSHDVLLRTVYDKIYSSAKTKQSLAGALIWQLIVEGMDEYADEFSLVAWQHPSTYELIIEQSCRVRTTFESGPINCTG